MRLIRRISKVAIGIVALASVGAARAQQPPPCNAAPFLATTSWQGTVTFSGTGVGTVQDSMGGTFTYSVNQTIQLSPVVNLSTTQPNSFQGAENASINVNDKYTYTALPPPGTPAFTQTYTTTAFGNTAMGYLNGGALLTMFSVGACGYGFGADDNFSPFTYTVNGQSSQNQGIWGPPLSGNMLVPPVTSSSDQVIVPFPTSGLELKGSTQFHAQPFDVPSLPDPLDVPDVVWIVSWDLVPVTRALDLIVTIPDYSTWRPTGGVDENTLGQLTLDTPNSLRITAQLVFKDTQQPTDFGPNQVVFTLTQYSAQPGVSMNWPPKTQVLANPTPPDLSFKDLSGLANFNTGFTYNSNGTQATYTPSSTAANPPVTAYLLPYDWGGWAVLTVTAYINGEDSVQGHFATDPTTNILLPKRQPNSYIADVWKIQHNVPLSTPDADDSEEAPVSKAGCTGDGLTLYEEYRGFMENEKHIEGDPNNKDFFIQNRIGSDAEPGIFLFTALTGLTVHKDLQQNEVFLDGSPTSPGGVTTLINFNHLDNDPTHVTDQHGVTLGSGSKDGGNTYLSVASVHGAPKITNVILMQFRDAPGSLNPGNTHNGSISATNAFLQYDVGVAHELLHAVGVDHHGDGDPGSQLFTFYPPQSPKNPTGQPVLLLNGQVIRFVSEQDGTDFTSAFWVGMQRLENLCKIINATPSFLWQPVYVDVCKNFETNLNGGYPLFPYVGLQHGQHSGNDQCVMRYFFANAYRSIADSSLYYATKAGTESVGSSLCSSPTGTGVNAATHQPQSRYGDAAAEADPSSIGRGSCQKWICVSDAYPLVSDTLRTPQ